MKLHEFYGVAEEAVEFLTVTRRGCLSVGWWISCIFESEDCGMSLVWLSPALMLGRRVAWGLSVGSISMLGAQLNFNYYLFFIFELAGQGVVAEVKPLAQCRLAPPQNVFLPFVMRES